MRGKIDVNGTEVIFAPGTENPWRCESEPQLANMASNLEVLYQNERSAYEPNPLSTILRYVANQLGGKIVQDIPPDDDPPSQVY